MSAAVNHRRATGQSPVSGLVAGRLVEPGNTVLLRYQAYPCQKFGHHIGRVTRVSLSAIRMSPAHRLAAGMPLTFTIVSWRWTPTN